MFNELEQKIILNNSHSCRDFQNSLATFYMSIMLMMRFLSTSAI